MTKWIEIHWPRKNSQQHATTLIRFLMQHFYYSGREHSNKQTQAVFLQTTLWFHKSHLFFCFLSYYSHAHFNSPKHRWLQKFLKNILWISKIKVLHSRTFSAELMHEEPMNVLSITVVKDRLFHTKTSFLIGFCTRLAAPKWVIYSRLKSNMWGK